MSLNLPPSGIPPDWAETLVDARAFRREQRCLSFAWTFLGLTVDVSRDGDWLRASIGGRSVFVQRFGTELRGFENRCAHRFFPLRTTDRGHGPVICGFHGWRYDQEGLAVGIPQCRDAFGVAPPQELGARLARLDIALCGTLIFGRFPSPAGGDSLEAFLADGFPILEAMSRMDKTPPRLIDAIAANWKLCMQISLDDYHLVSIHPTTLGRTGPVRIKHTVYRRFGSHAAYLHADRQDAFDEMLRRLADGTFHGGYYGVFHLCPSTFLVLFNAYGPYWYCGVIHYEALAHDRTAMRAWVYPAPFAAPRPRGVLAGLARVFRPVSEFVRAAIVRRVVMRVLREDHRACEALQTNAAAVDRAPMLSKLETRIGWFEESYRALVAKGAASLKE